MEILLIPTKWQIPQIEIGMVLDVAVVVAFVVPVIVLDLVLPVFVLL